MNWFLKLFKTKRKTSHKYFKCILSRCKFEIQLQEKEEEEYIDCPMCGGYMVYDKLKENDKTTSNRLDNKTT